jgi:hypothetical protein
MKSAGWVIEDNLRNVLIFPNFCEYNEPACLRHKPKSNAARQKEFRERKAKELKTEKDTVTSVTKRNDREEKRREEKKEEIRTPLPPKGDVVDEKDSEKPTTKKKPATTTELNPIPAPLNTPEFIAAWEAWKTHRAEIKHPLTATSYNTILSKCEKLGAVEAVRWIWNAIEKGWRGLYPPDDDKNKGSNNGTSNGRMGSGIEKFFGADEKYEAKDRHVSSEDKPQPPENLFAKSDS